MLQRNLVYTAITRAKSKLILLGEKSAFDYAVKNTGTARKTYLIQRFEDIEPPQKLIHTPVGNGGPPVENYILTEENFQKIDPMIGITEDDINSIFEA